MGRKRDRRLPVCFTLGEYERVENLSKRFGYKNNVSAYVRRRSLNNKFIIENIEGKNEVIEEVARIGNNINQAVKAMNIIALKSRVDRNEVLEIKVLAKNIAELQKEVNAVIREKLFVSSEQSEVKDDHD